MQASYHNKVGYFLDRLRDDDTVDIIREISVAINNSSGQEQICSDPYEDMNIGIEYPNFCIEDFRLPLIEMKNILYEWLNSLNDKTPEYFNDIEEGWSGCFRTTSLLKFKNIPELVGKHKNVCESFLKSNKPLCFVQFCSLKDCNRMLKKIDKAIVSGKYTGSIYENRSENISIWISSNWFKIGTFANENCMGINLYAAKQFINEWIEFIKSQVSKT